MAINEKSTAAHEHRYAVLPDRMPAPALEQMSEAQKKVVADLTATRGELRGPFTAIIHSPKLADRLQQLGAFIRYDCSLDLRINRIVSLMVARHWSAQYEWWVAIPFALKAGVNQSIIDAIADNRRPDNMAADEEITYAFVGELLVHKSVSDATYARAEAAFGKTGVIDMLGVAGYYTMQAMIMNVVRTPLPPGEAPPLSPAPQSMKAVP
jgi:4-carboxymuconolactone decarboxylase